MGHGLKRYRLSPWKNSFSDHKTLPNYFFNHHKNKTTYPISPWARMVLAPVLPTPQVGVGLVVLVVVVAEEEPRLLSYHQRTLLRKLRQLALLSPRLILTRVCCLPPRISGLPGGRWWFRNRLLALGKVFEHTIANKVVFCLFRASQKCKRGFIIIPNWHHRMHVWKARR